MRTLSLRARLDLAFWWFAYGPLSWSEAWTLSGVYASRFAGGFAAEGEA